MMDTPPTKEMNKVVNTQVMLDSKIDYMMNELTKALEMARELYGMYKEQEKQIDQLLDSQAIQLAQWQLILKSLLQLQDDGDYLGESVMLEQNQAIAVVSHLDTYATKPDEGASLPDTFSDPPCNVTTPHGTFEAYSQLLDDLKKQRRRRRSQQQSNYTSMWHVFDDVDDDGNRFTHLPPITEEAVSSSRSPTPDTAPIPSSSRKQENPYYVSSS